MAEKKNLNENELNDVSGGVYRTVNTGMKMDAVVRSGPGLSYPQISSLPNGTQANTTGNVARGPEGYDWYEINYPVYGWMKGTLLGYFS